MSNRSAAFYPETVDGRMVFDDRDLIDIVREGCGDGVAQLVEQRMNINTAGCRDMKEMLRDLRDALSCVVSEAEDCADAIDDALEVTRNV